MILRAPSSSSSPVWSPEPLWAAVEARPVLLVAVELADELAEGGVCLEAFVLVGVEVARGVAPELDPREGLTSACGLWSWPLEDLDDCPRDPVGFWGWFPEVLEAEIGGELALIIIDEFRPKQTLSLALGAESSIIDPPEVSSLVAGKKVPTSRSFSAGGGGALASKLSLLIDNSSRVLESEGEG